MSILKDFTFKKNERGYSDRAFRILRHTIIPATRKLFNPRITNPEYMPQTGPCFIYGNHSNYFDPFMINVDMYGEPTAGVMTRDQFHKTLPRIFMDGIGIVPTSKYVPEPGIVRSVIRMIEQKRMIIIFPEGGRRWDGKPKPLIETTLKLFWKMGIPVHPVQIHGSYLAWPRWADKYRKGSVEMRYLKPLLASDFDNYEEFAKACIDRIDFEEYSPPDGAVPVSCNKPASGIQRFLYRCPDTGATGAVYSPDGSYVYSRNSEMKYRMDVASRLIDGKGQVHSLIDMFEHINSMPMELQKGEVLLEKSGSELNRLDDDQKLQYVGRCRASLTKNEIELNWGSDDVKIPFEDIRALSIEQNHKLTVNTVEQTLQFNLEGGSALQWQIYINRLKDGEKPVKSL
jgi:1-acyl-sn-glycerol-3-phosphate acyltransferase